MIQQDSVADNKVDENRRTMDYDDTDNDDTEKAIIELNKET